MSAMEPTASGALAFMRSTFTPKRILTSMAVGGSVAGGLGFVGSGGEPRGIVSGIGGGMKGSISGGLKGALALGAVGAAAGLGMSTTAGRSMFLRAVRNNAGWLGSKIPQTVLHAIGDTSGRTAVRRIGKNFANAPIHTLAALGGLAGGMAGLAIGDTVGGVLGAWSAGRNIRSSTAYNNFSGIGM